VAIVVGFDVHRGQITFDALDGASGEVTTGRIAPADRQGLRRFLERWDGERLEAAVEATTGWRFVVEELQRAGATVVLAEPAETSARRGPKRRAKTDKRDARHLRDLLLERRLPRAWIPPEHILELRARVRLRKTLVDQRTEWLQRIHAVLFHHGVKLTVARLDGRDARDRLIALDLTPSARQQIEVALAMVEHVNAQLTPLDRELKAFARQQPGCRALMRHYGIGPQVACAILAELGDARRFSSSPCTSPTRSAAPATSPARGRRCCAGPRSRRPSRRASPARPTTPTTSSSRSASARTAPCSPSPASCCAARITRCASSATKPCSPPPEPPRPRVRAPSPHVSDHRGRLPQNACLPPPGPAGPERLSGRTAPRGIPHLPSCRRAHRARAPR
jgi:transposase